MKRQPRSHFLLYGIYLSLVLLGESCLISADTQTEGGFWKDQAAKIQPGKTTRQEILQWLGPPAAIARKNGNSIGNVSAESGDNSEEISPEDFFGKFSPKQIIREMHIVYYYYFVRRTAHLRPGPAILLPQAAPVIRPTEIERKMYKLWILINQESGLVEDYVLTKDEKITRHPYFENP